MSLDDYEVLTGTTVSDSARAKMTAQLDRAQSLLETSLGFALDPDEASKNLYNEAGQLKAPDLSCWYLASNPVLDPADDVVGAYRVFPFNAADTYLHVDPFTELHAVKLVIGDITVVTLDPRSYQPRRERGEWSKYLHVDKFWPYGVGGVPTWWAWGCTCGQHRLQLAVDADWLDEVPTDLKFIQADIATFYSNPNRKVKSEALGARSYTLSDTTSPAEDTANAAIIQRYAGPYGTAGRGVVL